MLALLVTHGVAVGPHLQNVLVGTDAAGMPAQVILRDLEGTKLVRDQHAARLDGLPAGVAAGLAYDSERAWNRVLYCLLVNHLAEIAAVLADQNPRPDLEARLWRELRHVLAKCAADPGWPLRLDAVGHGAPLPGKANLRVRWARAADREARYVPIPSPLSRARSSPGSNGESTRSGARPRDQARRRRRAPGLCLEAECALLCRRGNLGIPGHTETPPGA